MRSTLYFTLALLILPLKSEPTQNRFKKTPDLPKNPTDLPETVRNVGYRHPSFQ